MYACKADSTGILVATERLYTLNTDDNEWFIYIKFLEL